MYMLSLLIGTALAASHDWCKTETERPENLAAIQMLKTAEIDGTALHRRQIASDATVNIPVYINGVVNTTNSDDTLSQAVLQEQFNVLTDRFAPYDITFTLKNISRFIDDDNAQGFSYYGWNSFKAQQRKGDYATLNLYYVTNMDDQTWGTGSCTMPSDISGGGSPIYTMLDGCTLTAYSTPGGVDAGKTYKGEVTVHEVGHWLSLLHTFNGESCDGDGDSIDDTPQESVWELNVCPVGRDSCPDKPGLDPIENYMDYAGEGCWTEFTPGQKERMHNAWWTLRSPSAEA